MLALYNAALPEDAYLFQQALGSPGALDESEVARWTEEPPFSDDGDTTDPLSHQYFAFTKSLAEVIHGVRLREQNLRDVQLRDEFSGQARGLAMRRLQEELAEMWLRWERVVGFVEERRYDPFNESREYTMLQHYLQWLARTICHLYYLKFLE